MTYITRENGTLTDTEVAPLFECERCGDELPYEEINQQSGMCHDCTEEEES